MIGLLHHGISLNNSIYSTTINNTKLIMKLNSNNELLYIDMKNT